MAITSTQNLVRLNCPWSIPSRFRRKRMKTLLELCEGKQKILDVGGTPEFWSLLPVPMNRITLLNPEERYYMNYRVMKADGRDMAILRDGEYDLVVSHSTIEHVGTPKDQKRMADEIRRVGRTYYVQSPHYDILVEPHFWIPLFQLMPRSMRIWILANVPTFAYQHRVPIETATAFVDSVRLIPPWEFTDLFPDAEIVTERFCGLPYSQIAIKR